MKNIEIKTLTPSYDKIEDRIRLSINYQDIVNRIDLMITRAFMIELMPILEEYFFKHYPHLGMQDDDIHINLNEQTQKTSDVSATNIEDIYLYQSIQDLLITINLRYDNDTKHTSMEFITKDGYKAFMMCEAEVLNNIIKLLKSSIPNFSWSISSYF
jgi:hypothetical protein